MEQGDDSDLRANSGKWSIEAAAGSLTIRAHNGLHFSRLPRSYYFISSSLFIRLLRCRPALIQMMKSQPLTNPPKYPYKILLKFGRRDYLVLNPCLLTCRIFLTIISYILAYYIWSDRSLLIDMKLSASSSIIFATLALSSSTASLAAPARDVQESDMSISPSVSDVYDSGAHIPSHCSAHRPRASEAKSEAFDVRSNRMLQIH